MTIPTPTHLAVALSLGALAACGQGGAPGEGGGRDQEGTPAPRRGGASETPHTWLQEGFVSPGTSAEALRERFGVPDGRTATPIPNRHVPHQTDTLVTLEYERGLTIDLYSVTGGEDLLQSVIVSSPGILSYDQPVDVGSEWETVTSILGPPSGRRDGTPFYECEGCPAAESPVYFEVADGVVQRIRFSYYVD